MKKFIKIVSIIILCFLVVILVLPFAFQGKILKMAKDQINSSLNAKADFDKLSLSFLRYFPNATVGLKKLYVAGINEFEGDTLFPEFDINEWKEVKRTDKEPDKENPYPYSFVVLERIAKK